jgi:small subunit ribosomal protein S16
MPARIRLQRHGKKGRPFYHIVIADGRAPRDGRFIEKIGTYNPITNPAEINLDIDKAVTWLQNGAQPSDTARAILSYKGVLYKAHLVKGVNKGAMTEEQAEAKFQEWLQQKQEKIENKRKGLSEQERNERKKALEAEAKIKDAKAAEVAKKRAKELDAERAESIAETAEQQAVVEDTVTLSEEVAEVAEETVAVAEKEAEVTEAPTAVAEEVAEATEQPTAEAEEVAEATEQPTAEAEEPVTEAQADETKVEEPKA